VWICSNNDVISGIAAAVGPSRIHLAFVGGTQVLMGMWLSTSLVHPVGFKVILISPVPCGVHWLFMYYCCWQRQFQRLPLGLLHDNRPYFIGQCEFASNNMNFFPYTPLSIFRIMEMTTGESADPLCLLWARNSPGLHIFHCCKQPISLCLYSNKGLWHLVFCFHFQVRLFCSGVLKMPWYFFPRVSISYIYLHKQEKIL
jgi:hypothetical protein